MSSFFFIVFIFDSKGTLFSLVLQGRLPNCQLGAIGTALDICFARNKLKTQNIMLKPLGTRVVVEPKEAETMTAGGLYIPDNAKEKPQQGVVVAVGPGAKDEPMEVKAGETVLYGKYAGTEVTVDGKKYLIVKQSDILAIL